MHLDEVHRKAAEVLPQGREIQRLRQDASRTACLLDERQMLVALISEEVFVLVAGVRRLRFRLLGYVAVSLGYVAVSSRPQSCLLFDGLAAFRTLRPAHITAVGDPQEGIEPLVGRQVNPPSPQVPLAHDRGRVPRHLEMLRNRDLAQGEPARRRGRQTRGDADARELAAGEQRCAGARADGAARVPGLQLPAALREAIDVGRLLMAASEAGVAIAQVVHKEQHKVRPVRAVRALPVPQRRPRRQTPTAEKPESQRHGARIAAVPDTIEQEHQGNEKLCCKNCAFYSACWSVLFLTD
mmetsp:Transcript_94222/g.266534  ORF Transcript_94222/g.266534 Transcript_94222/m.266534 type:complete len:297 (-) Transcript_94222:41-931(-)